MIISVSIWAKLKGKVISSKRNNKWELYRIRLKYAWILSYFGIIISHFSFIAAQSVHIVFYNRFFKQCRWWNHKIIAFLDIKKNYDILTNMLCYIALSTWVWQVKEMYDREEMKHRGRNFLSKSKQNYPKGYWFDFVGKLISWINLLYSAIFYLWEMTEVIHLSSHFPTYISFMFSHPEEALYNSLIWKCCFYVVSLL